MAAQKLIPAVVLTAHTSGLAVIRALGINNVPVIAVYYEDHDMGIVSRYIKEALYAPHPESDAAGFMQVIKGIYEKYGRSIIIPADDATLIFTSRHKDLLSQWFVVSATDLDITKLYVEKKYTYTLGEKAGVPVPKTLVPNNTDQVMRYSEEVMYPILIKPSQSHRYFEIFRKKMKTAFYKEELLKYYEEAAEYNLEVMLQELIPGESSGVNYNSIFINNEPVVEFISEKIRYSPDNFGVPCAVKTIPLISEVVDSGRKILKAMGFNGFSCTEFKQDPRDGKYKLMEVNGRHNRSALLAVKAGINFPWLLYKYETSGEIPAQSEYKKNFYWIDESRDLMSTFPKTLKNKYPFKEFLTPYLNEHVFAVLDRQDLRPIFKRVSDIIKLTFDRKKPVHDVMEVKEIGAR